MRILFVNHTGACSGAENAMLRLLRSLPADHSRAVACPPEGELKRVLLADGVEQFDVPGTELSLALHPTRTPVGLGQLARAAGRLRSIARRFGADVIHANSVRAGLMASLARGHRGPPVVVQCHDNLPESAAGMLTRRLIARQAEIVVAVSDATAATFNAGLRRPKAERVYISVDHDRFSPRADAAEAVRAELSLPPDARVLAQVAQITPWKGQDTAIRALAAVRERFDAHLLVVGDVTFASQRYDNVAFRESLERLVEELGVEHAVHFLGRRDDVPELMAAAELILLPSWDEPFGLVVAESMAVGTPAIVTDRGGLREYVTDGVNGRLVPPDDSGAWATAIGDLLADREALSQMSERCLAAATEFTDQRYVQNMLDVYARAAR